MGCAPKAVYMDHNSKLPVVLEYYPQHPPLFAYLGHEQESSAAASWSTASVIAFIVAQ